MAYCVAGIEIPEPFAGALREGRAASVRHEAATTPAGLFGRALARAATGNDLEAREDFAACAAHWPDPCTVELALLDLRHHQQATAARNAAQAVAERNTENVPLCARAWHVVGLAENRLRHTGPAVEALLRALAGYQQSGNALGRAQVRDTLGLVEAARGRIDFAVDNFALSLVDKALLGDLPGLAITLGNLGRANVRSGRFAQAAEYFERDLELCHQLDDRRGAARMFLDLGRCRAGLENWPAAEANLQRAVALAHESHFQDLELLAHAELAQVFLKRANISQAGRELELALPLLGAEPEAYLQINYDLARGEWLAAQANSHAQEVLQSAVQKASENDLPDLEIACRLALARALLAARYKALAEQCLQAGLKLARREGFARYLPLLNEEMTRLDLVEGVVEEQARPLALPGAAHAPAASPTAAYVVRQRLGGGAFGDVFRVYDPVRGCDVALKQLRLARVYDVRERRAVLASAKRELEAASRIRHPGVVRVLAVGEAAEGDVYVVQEFVDGASLRAFIPSAPTASAAQALRTTAQIAFSLAALHEAGVVHRDLKPENILVRSDGQPVLVDFGIAHLSQQGPEHHDQVLGTLPYMSPEQALGKSLDARADLYALGVVLFEWLAGVRPLRLRGETLAEQVRDLAHRVPPSLDEFRPGLPPELNQLIAQLLSKKARQRPASAVLVAEACQTLSARVN